MRFFSMYETAKARSCSGRILIIYLYRHTYRPFDLKSYLHSKISSALGFGAAPSANVNGDVMKINKMTLAEQNKDVCITTNFFWNVVVFYNNVCFKLQQKLRTYV